MELTSFSLVRLFCIIYLFGTAPSHLDIHKEHLHAKYHRIVAMLCCENDLLLGQDLNFTQS